MISPRPQIPTSTDSQSVSGIRSDTEPREDRRLRGAAVLRLALFLLLTAGLLLSTATAQADFSDRDIRRGYSSSYRYEKTQNYADAIKVLLPIRKAYPRGYTINLRLGWLYYMKGNFANSELHYQRAIQIAPQSIEAKLGCLLPMMAQQRFEETEVLARQILQIDAASYYGNLRLAQALRPQNKLEQAAFVVNAMLVLYPTDVPYLTELALIEIDRERPDSARNILLNIQILDPENVTARQKLSEMAP